MQSLDIDAPTVRRTLKALVYGRSGTGKTGFGVSAPRALILLNELQGVANIRDAQRRIGRKPYAVLHMRTLGDYRQVLRALHGDRSKPFTVYAAGAGDQEGGPTIAFQRDEWPETVVLDSLTEAIELIMKEIREQSPPKEGRDGLPVDSERFWNVLFDRASNLIRSFRDVDMNILYLCLLDEKLIGEDDAKTKWMGPQLVMRRIPGVVMAAVNVVGVTRRQFNKDGAVYGISTLGPSYMELKPFPPLRKDEVMDFTSWCQRIAGIDDGSVSPALAPEELDPKAAEPEGAIVVKRTTLGGETTEIVVEAVKTETTKKLGKTKAETAPSAQQGAQ